MPNHKPLYMRLGIDQPLSLNDAQFELRTVQKLLQCLYLSRVGQQYNMRKLLTADVGVCIESLQQPSFFRPLARNYDCATFAPYRIEQSLRRRFIATKPAWSIHVDLPTEIGTRFKYNNRPSERLALRGFGVRYTTPPLVDQRREAFGLSGPRLAALGGQPSVSRIITKITKIYAFMRIQTGGLSRLGAWLTKR